MVRTYLESFGRPTFCAICFTRSFYLLTLLICFSNSVFVFLKEPEVGTELEEDWCEVVPYACVADDHEAIDDEEEAITAAALRYGHVDVPRALHS